jgi:hypothetical protein
MKQKYISPHERNDKSVYNLGSKSKRKRLPDGLDVDDKVILNLILKKQEWKDMYCSHLI